MNNKEAQDLNKRKDYMNSSSSTELNKLILSFCPVCGNKISKIQNLKFCINWGTNIN